MDIKLLKKKNYLTLIENSARGENWMFRNFYIEKDGEVTDALEDGENSCAVVVTNILVLLNDFFHWIKGPHATVVSAEKDLMESGWYEIEELRIGAILLWEKLMSGYGKGHKHLGFYVGNDTAISNDAKIGMPRKHHYTYNDTRKIEKIYWHSQLDE